MSQTAILRHRRDDAATWASLNPVLEDGQLGFERDTLRYKMGDGASQWNSLPYALTPAPVPRGAAWAMSDGSALSGPFPDVILYFPVQATLRKITLLGQAPSPGDCEVDILIEPLGDWPDTPASIVGSTEPEITAGYKYEDSTLTGWTTVIPADSVMIFQLVSSSGFRRVNVSLDLEIF